MAVKYRSSSVDRKVQVYLKTRTYMMFHAEKGALLRKDSEHAARIIEKYYESLPESNQRALVEQYDRMNKK